MSALIIGHAINHLSGQTKNTTPSKKSCLHHVTAKQLCFSVHIFNSVGTCIELQRKLLDKDNVQSKPDAEFLKSFSGVVGSLWPLLAASLSLSESEIEEVKTLPQQDQPLQMLRKWVSREDATYGHLYQTLKTISLFQYK